MRRNPIPRPLPQQAREGERAESRWHFILIFVLSCARIHKFINELPFPSSLGLLPREAGGLGGAGRGWSGKTCPFLAPLHWWD